LIQLESHFLPSLLEKLSTVIVSGDDVSALPHFRILQSQSHAAQQLGDLLRAMDPMFHLIMTIETRRRRDGGGHDKQQADSEPRNPGSIGPRLSQLGAFH
jgi:hypothetical protein